MTRGRENAHAPKGKTRDLQRPGCKQQVGLGGPSGKSQVRADKAAR